jgi:uncharacterized membrane protein
MKNKLLLGCLAGTILIASLILIWRINYLSWLFGIYYFILLPGLLLLFLLFKQPFQFNRLIHISLIVPIGVAVSTLILLLQMYLYKYDYQVSVIVSGILNLGFLIGAYIRSGDLLLEGTGLKPIRLSKSSYFVIFFSLILIVASIYAYLLPKQTRTYTEFYYLDEHGSLPLTLKQNSDECLRIRIGIINHESQDKIYFVQIQRANQILQITNPFWVRNEQKWEDEVTITCNKINPGTEITIGLYRADDTQPYRKLRFIQ